MPRASPGQTNFNAGEWSPALEGRVDLERYPSACRTLENFLPMVQGGAVKRPGIRHVKAVKDSADPTRLIPFQFSTTQAYILEFGDQYMRVYKDSGAVTEAAKNIDDTTAGTPVSVGVTGHAYITGDEVFIDGTGDDEIDGQFWVITTAGPNDFTLDGSSSAASTVALGTAARVYEITTSPYAAADVGSISYAQSADVLYLAHPDYPPQKVERTGHAAWTITEIDFDWQPFEEENLDEDSYVVASATTGNGISVYSSAGIFAASDVGRLLKLSEIAEGMNPEWSATTNLGVGATSAAAGFRPWSNAGAYVVGGLAQYDGNVYALLDRGGSNFTGPAAPVHRSGTATDGQWVWEYLHSGSGYVEITAFVNANKVTANVIKRIPHSAAFTPVAITNIAATNPIRLTVATAADPFIHETGDLVWIEGTSIPNLNNKLYSISRVIGTTTQIDLDGTTSLGAGSGGVFVRMRSFETGTASQATAWPCFPNRWAWGAWAPAGTTKPGYPRAVAFFEDRLWWAGAAGSPQGLWGSRTARYEDHEEFDQDDSAVFFVLNSDQVNTIEWLSPSSILLIGTAGGEFVLAGAGGDPVTPGNVRAIRNATYGSKPEVAPVRAENVALFVQRAGRRVIEFAYDDASQSYTGVDLNVFAEHIARQRIIRMAWQQEPRRLLWCVLADGTLACLTYERAQEVLGWHHHPVGGSFGGGQAVVEDVAVIPHESGDRDQVWFIVKRTIDGNTVRYVEYLENEWERDGDIEDAFFVDSGLTYDGAPKSTIKGLKHLEGESVAVLADGVQVTGLSVSSGAITLAAAASVVQIGLGYTATAETMRIEAGARDGIAQGKTKRIDRIVIRVDQTGRGLQYGPSAGVLDTYAITAGTLKDGDTESLAWPGGYEQEARVLIRHATPLPCTVIALWPQLETQDRG